MLTNKNSLQEDSMIVLNKTDSTNIKRDVSPHAQKIITTKTWTLRVYDTVEVSSKNRKKFSCKTEFIFKSYI